MSDLAGKYYKVQYIYSMYCFVMYIMDFWQKNIFFDSFLPRVCFIHHSECSEHSENRYLIGYFVKGRHYTVLRTNQKW